MADQEQWTGDSSIIFGAALSTGISTEIVMPHVNVISPTEQYYPTSGSEQFQDLRNPFLYSHQPSHYSQNGFNNSYASINVNMGSTSNNMPYLEIIEQPLSKYRFRYESEKGSHGGLQGCNSKTQRKTYPTVQLKNFNDSRHVKIHASLFTNDDEPVLHVHRLIQTRSQLSGDSCEIELKEDRKAVFQNLSILFKGKKDVPRILHERLIDEWKRKGYIINENHEKILSDQAEKQANDMNLDYVRICFKAFVKNPDNNWELLCEPVFSSPIANKKSPDSGELRISRMDKYAGSCMGNEEVFLLCEKVNKKEIKVRFLEVDTNGLEIWKGFGSFSEADVHHQVAIVFKTPPYKNENIKNPVKVQVQLFREKDGEVSESKEFTYTPTEPDIDRIEIKRRKVPYDDKSYHMQNYEGRTSYETSFTYPNISTPHERGSSSSMTSSEFFSGSNQGYQSSESLSSFSDAEVMSEENIARGLLPTSSDPLICGGSMLPSFPQTFKRGGFLQTDSVRTNVDSVSEKFREMTIKKEAQKPPQTKGSPSKSYTFDTREKSLARFCLQAFRKYVISNDLESLLTAMRHLMPVQDEEGDNIIHLAVLHQPSNLQLLEHLLKVSKGLPCNVLNQRNNRSQTPLHLAAVNKYPEVVNILLTYGADPNVQEIKGNTPLHLAVHKNNVENVRELVTFKNYNQRLSSRNVQVDILNYDGYTPLHLAVKENKFHCVSHLCEAGARIDAKDGTSGHTSLHLAVEHSPDFLHFLLQKETAEVNAQNYGGNTALHLACVRNDYQIAYTLMQAKADPNIQNFERNEVSDEGSTAFDFSHQNEQMLKILNKRTCDFVTAEPNKISQFVEAKQTEESETFDSGFLSGSICMLDQKTVIAVSNLLNDPPDKWKSLAMYLGFDDDKIRGIEKTSDNPTELLLKQFETDGKSKSDLIQVLEFGGFDEVLNIVQDD